MTKKTFTLLFFSFSLLFILPVWLFPFLPFVDLPQHLNFAFVLKNYSQLGYEKFYSLRLFPMHNTLHLFFNYLFSFFFPLEASNKIYVTISLLLFPLALLFFLKVIGGNEYFSLLGFLVAYNYNLFWGFMGINLGIALILFLIGYEIKYLKEKIKIKYLIFITLLFSLLFLCHSLTYLFSLVTYLLLLIFIPTKEKKIYLLIPLIVPFLLFFLPWQIGQFRGEGSELQTQFREYISPSALYSNLWDFLRRVGLKTDETYIFILKIIFVVSLLTTYHLLRKRGLGYLLSPTYRPLSLFFLSTFLFYAFFPGTYTEAVFLNERFAPLLFLLMIVFLALNLKEFNRPILKYLFILIITFVGINITFRIALFNREAKPVKEMISKLPEGRRLAGLIYQKKQKADLFGYDVFLHFPAYYSIYRKGFVGFTFAYIRYSPIIYNDSFPLPRIDEWETWYSVFPEGWEKYDYFLVTGEPRPSDQPLVEKWRLIEKKGIWSLYEVPPEIKPPKEETEE